MDPIFIPLGAFVMVGWIVWVTNKREQARVEAMAAIQSRTLEKFGSAPEFVEFLRSEEGRKYLSSFGTPSPKHPARKVIGSVSAGVVMVIVAMGFYTLGFTIPSDNRWEEPPVIIATIALFLGVGLIAAAIVSYRLSKAFGLLNGKTES